MAHTIASARYAKLNSSTDSDILESTAGHIKPESCGPVDCDSRHTGKLSSQPTDMPKRKDNLNVAIENIEQPSQTETPIQAALHSSKQRNESTEEDHTANFATFSQSLDAPDCGAPHEPNPGVNRVNERSSSKSKRGSLPFIFGKKRTEAQNLKRAYLAQSSGTNDFTDHYDYLRKYPEDTPEEAMGPSARVWRVYLDEAEQFDIDMVDCFKDTVDIMLVFAGLFSAVATTFVVQASTALRLDYGQVIASAMLEQLAIQRAFFNGSRLPDPLSSTLNLSSSTKTGLDRWVNGLWFTSLSFSLATALFAVLVKQWIQAYVSPVSGPPQTRARVRQYRYLGLEKWHVYGIVGLLPTLLHLSLFFFLAGLVAFLLGLDHILAIVTASIAGLVYIICIFTNLAPVFDSQCPYKTPLSTYLLFLLHSLYSRPQIIRQSVVGAESPESTEGNTLAAPAQRISASSFMKKVELEDIEAVSDYTDAKALCWVINWSSNPSVATVVLEATGDLPIGFTAKSILRDEGVGNAACTALQTCTAKTGNQWKVRVRPGFERLHLKSALVHFHLGWYYVDNMPVYPHSRPYMRKAQHTPCIIPSSAASTATVHSEEDRHLGPYFILLLKSSDEATAPHNVARWMPPHSPRIIFLRLLQRAALYSQDTPSARIPFADIDWSSCRKLSAAVQIEPPPSDLFGLWQTTLISIYLRSMLPQNSLWASKSTLLPQILFNQIDLGQSDLSLDRAIELSVQCCFDALFSMLREPTASMNSSVWSSIRPIIESLARYTRRATSSSCQQKLSAPKLDFNCTFAALNELTSNTRQWNQSTTPLSLLTDSLALHVIDIMSRGWEPDLEHTDLYEQLLTTALATPEELGVHLVSEAQLCFLSLLFDWQDIPPRLVDVFRDMNGIHALCEIGSLIAHSTWETKDEQVSNAVSCVLAYAKRILAWSGASPVSNEMAPPQPLLSSQGRQAHGGTRFKDLSTDPFDYILQSLERTHFMGLSTDPFTYLLQSLVPLIQICATDTTHPPTTSHTPPDIDPLYILQLIAKTRPDASEWDSAIEELDNSIQELDQAIEEVDLQTLRLWRRVKEITLILASTPSSYRIVLNISHFLDLYSV